MVQAFSIGTGPKSNNSITYIHCKISNLAFLSIEADVGNKKITASPGPAGYD